MRNKLLTLAGALALLAVLGRFYAEPLLAQVRSALVKNIDEPGRRSFSLPIFCQDTGSCSSNSFVVQPNTKLVIENVNFRMSLPHGAFADVQLLDDNQGATHQFFLPYSLAFSVGQTDLYYVNQRLVAYFDAGRSGNVQINTGSAGAPIQVFGTITGYTVDLTQ